LVKLHTSIAPISIRSRQWQHDCIADPVQGPLPALLLLLTVSTGLINAVSSLSLGRQHRVQRLRPGRDAGILPRRVTDCAGLVPARRGVGGVAVHRLDRDHGWLLRNVVAAELLLVAAAAVRIDVAGTPFRDTVRDVTVALAAGGLGLQSAAERRLAVPDITTTVLTMTLTGITADLRKRNVRVALRRSLSVAAMLAGALTGALLILHIGVLAALFTASGVIAVALLGSSVAARRPAPWQTEPRP